MNGYEDKTPSWLTVGAVVMHTGEGCSVTVVSVGNWRGGSTPVVVHDANEEWTSRRACLAPLLLAPNRAHDHAPHSAVAPSLDMLAGPKPAPKVPFAPSSDEQFVSGPAWNAMWKLQAEVNTGRVAMERAVRLLHAIPQRHMTREQVEETRQVCAALMALCRPDKAVR